MRSLKSFIMILLCVLAGATQASAARAPQLAREPFAPQTDTMAVDPNDCSTYTDYKRWFFDSQAWWQDKNQDYFMQEHLHLGTCFPHAQTVAGTVPFDAVIKLHNNPGVITWVRVQIYLPSSDPNYGAIKKGCHGDGIVCYDPQPPLRCPANVMDCTFNIHLDVDTTKFPYDGLQEFRLATNMDMGNSTVMYQTNGWRAYLANGKPVKPVGFDSTLESVEGRGWHTGTNYTNARLDNFPKDTLVSGIWTFKVRLDKGADGTPVTEHEILIDPNIHGMSRGVSVPITVKGIAKTAPYLGSGPFSGSVSIDTRQLTNGVHKLMLRAGSQISAPPGTNSGVIVVPFTVQN
jgi:hypothetical protein